MVTHRFQEFTQITMDEFLILAKRAIASEGPAKAKPVIEDIIRNFELVEG